MTGSHTAWRACMVRQRAPHADRQHRQRVVEPGQRMPEARREHAARQLVAEMARMRQGGAREQHQGGRA